MSRHPLSKDFEDTGPLAGPCLSLDQLTKVHLIPIHLEYASFLLIEPKIQANRPSEPSCRHPHLQRDPLERCIDSFGSDRIACHYHR